MTPNATPGPVEVTPADRERAAAFYDQQNKFHYADSIRAGEFDVSYLVQSFARHRIEAARPVSGEPVAYLYTRDDGSKDLLLSCNGEYARNLLEVGATETPLYAARPVQSELVEALEGLISHCRELECAITEDLHHVDYCGESIVLCNARTTLAALKETDNG
ncbi:hypothetical protein ACQKO5_18940 [Novosphingobium subterraneum]|uniref:hypothetical protein n=1 Tax=Novosphingobium subterraneum TaxID=48936 RepID=UPI003D007FED